MSLIPGGTKPDGAGFRYALDDTALANSMALAMEQEMAKLYHGVKNMPLPPAAAQDMRMLFAAIARGVLGYLSNNEAGNIVAQPAGIHAHKHQVHLSVAMNQP